MPFIVLLIAITLLLPVPIEKPAKNNPTIVMTFDVLDRYVFE